MKLIAHKGNVEGPDPSKENTPEQIDWWLAGRQANLWIHCKDLTTLHEFTAKTSGYNYFWHQGDDYTLTSKGQIWASAGKPYNEDTVMVVEDPAEVKEYNCYAMCSDHVGKLK